MLTLAKEDGTINELYVRLLNHLLKEGHLVSPRGKKTRELLGTQISVPMKRTLITIKERALNYRFAIAEFFWMIAGRNDVGALIRFNSQMLKFSDDGISLAGAYGPRIMSQWDWARDNLKNDHESRQSVIMIWRPNPMPSKDVPCTLSFQFFIRTGHLHLMVNMRSSDAWLGIPYDIFTFSNIGCCMAAELGVNPGNIFLTLGSSHLYEDNWDQAAALIHRSEADFEFEIPYLDPQGRAAGYLDSALRALGPLTFTERPVVSELRSWDIYSWALASGSSAKAMEVLRAATDKR